MTRYDFLRGEMNKKYRRPYFYFVEGGQYHPIITTSTPRPRGNIVSNSRLFSQMVRGIAGGAMLGSITCDARAKT